MTHGDGTRPDHIVTHPAAADSQVRIAIFAAILHAGAERSASR